MANVDIACVGNVIIDAFFSIPEDSDHTRINTETGELCFKVGEKVPVDSAVFQLGGNACNVSVGLSRLGFRTALIAEIGTETFTNKIKTTLMQEGVNISHLVESNTADSIAVGINFKDDRSLFVHHVQRQHNFSYDHLQSKWMYLSSMGESWRHVYREVPAYVKRTGTKLAFNPGTRQVDAQDIEALSSALSVAEVLFLNKEEALKVLGMKREKKHTRQLIDDLLFALQKLGPKIVIITDGNHGSFILDKEGKVHHESVDRNVPIVERTGAGDGFATGFLGAIMYGYDIPTAMKWGTKNAGSVIGKVGAQPGLLTKAQIERKLKA